MWSQIQNALYEGAGSGLFYLCLILMFMMDKDKKLRYKVIYPCLLFFILYINPWTFEHVWLKLMKDTVHRAMMCIPTAFIIAFVISAFWSQTKKWDAVLAGILIVILMVLCYDDRNEKLIIAENLYGMPQDTLDVCEMVLSEEEEPLLLVSYPDANYFRQYSDDIRLLFGEDVEVGKMSGAKKIPQDYRTMSNLMKEDIIKMDTLVDYADKYDVDYIIINLDVFPKIELIKTTWYELYTTIGSYMIFKHV